MTINELNNLLSTFAEQKRENIISFSFALLEWMGITPNTDVPGHVGEIRPRLTTPQTQKLKDFLAPAPLTVQPQLYRLSAEGQNMKVRFAVLKKLKKDTISQLVDNDLGLTSYQASIRGIVNVPGRPPYIPQQPYFIHFVTTPAYDKLVLIFNQGDQKRIVTFRKHLTNTQYHKILEKWQYIGAKTKPEIAELIWKSIDIKEVNREFYKQIKERFDSLVGFAKTQNTGLNEEAIKQFTVRLIGRYIFCWFLKEKGVIPPALLSSDTIQNYRDSFFQLFLKKLFFKTLNAEVTDPCRTETITPLDDLYKTIPYLNGGLFDFHAEDVLFDQLDLNNWLITFVKVLEEFDFTVDESSSQYQMVAIDPEMLGRIFENLLASQNEETEKLANQRKAFGAFYTPREIVDYMVNESLKAHLETQLMPAPADGSFAINEPMVEYKGTLFQHLESPQILMDFQDKKYYADNDRRREKIKANITKLFSTDCSENPFDKEDTILVRKALNEITVLDPACGSGAFPMGMMLRLMELRQIVGHGHRNSYDLKEEILSRNIFGVDIMPMAVEIARLRAWLSLVLEAEYKPADRKNNFGIAALPNLDFKFVCANSLIDSGYDEFLSKIKYNQTLYRLDGEIQKLQKIRDEYFDPKGDKTKKDKLQNEFESTKEYIKQQINTGTLKKNYNLEDFFSKVDDWNPFDDSHPSPFFSPAWMFGITDGFDVVIGNPPYVQMQKDNGRLANQLKNAGYSTFERTGDVYAIFYELGFKVLRKEGIHTFITSSQWLKANYGKSLRKLFLSKNPLKLISLGPGVFESAVVDTNILIAKNGKNQNELRGGTVDKPEQLNYLAGLPFQPMPYVTVEQWAIMGDGKQSINKKLNIKGKALKDWNVKINFGIKTGYNEAFIINEVKRKELIKLDPNSEKLIRPILKGREIDKYISKWENDYIVFIPWHFPLQDNPKIVGASEDAEMEFSEKYKTIYDYLKSHKKGLSERNQDETGIRYEWYALQRCAATYRDEFSKEKVVWKRIGSQLRFSYSDEEIYCLDSTCIATGEKIKYITALLNSKLCNYQLFESAPKTGMGDLIISVQALEPLLVYYPTDKEQKQIEKLVDQILSLKKQNLVTTSLEKEIDVLVYKLYELTYDEVKIIDKDFWLSEEEYEKLN